MKLKIDYLYPADLSLKHSLRFCIVILSTLSDYSMKLYLLKQPSKTSEVKLKSCSQRFV